MVEVDSGMPDSSWCPGGGTGEGKRVNEERKGGNDRGRKGEKERGRRGGRKRGRRGGGKS